TGWNGLILSLAVIMFSFGGLELIGITAAEARDPEKSIPKAVNQVVYRMSANENNLIWIDLEMTGLDPERDRIIE
ncbi:hypothetical protein JVV93_20875, partial [Vibrio cholerae O1]|nr:hypothetical protein [Vibrio cholerae O1]